MSYFDSKEAQFNLFTEQTNIMIHIQLLHRDGARYLVSGPSWMY